MPITILVVGIFQRKTGNEYDKYKKNSKNIKRCINVKRC